MKKISVILFAIIFCIFSASIIYGEGQKEASSEELTKVKIGITPYTMYQIWNIADAYDIDEEFGLDIEMTNVTQTMNGVQALIRGDVDITSNCIAEHCPTFESAPNVVGFSTIGFFQGFFYVGRKGEVVPFEELKAQHGLEKAKEMRLKEFEGAEFCIIPQRKALILDTIQQVGLTADDVKFLNFADDQKAAVAFMRGSGDYYIGSLPQERKLISMPEYVDAGGAEILGPGGLWYDTMVSTTEWIENNEETALRLLGTLYRSVRLFDERTEEVAEIGAKGISKLTGGDFSTEEYITMQTQYDDFLSIEDAKSGFYNKNSELYWKYPVRYYVEMAKEQGDLKNPGEIEQYFMWEELFNEFLSRDDLVDKVYAPFN